MSAPRSEFLGQLAELRETARTASEAFARLHQPEVDRYRKLADDGVDEALARMQRQVAELSHHNVVCEQLTARTAEYVGWMKWALWDLPFFAVAIRPRDDRFRSSVAACALVYLSIRIFDDVVDQHFWYKGRRPTLLAVGAEIEVARPDATGLSILGALLVCFEGLERLSSGDPALPPGLLVQVVRRIRGAVVGAIMEYSRPEEWTPEYYQRMVQLKNVDYWRAQYAALDPDSESPLYPFLERYYELAQHLNDIEDFDEDQRDRQPNLLTIHRGPGQESPCPPIEDFPQPVSPEIELALAERFLALGETAATLPEPERSIALSKLLESLDATYRLGVFAVPETLVPVPRPTPRVYWYSDLGTVTNAFGSDALESIACPVCSGVERAHLFEKQGFSYQRCLDCTHIYVSPRIRTFVQDEIREELDALSMEDDYLEAQRFHAEWICQFLRERAQGARLLDVGFGRGYLIRLAQAHGFEVYGVESSEHQVRRLTPSFGGRVTRVVVGEDAIPWGEFDVVVMSHVLEHLADPGRVLDEIRALLNPGGLFYLCVPDTGSTHFQLFGKRWDVVNPLAHLQYFSEASLSRLLQTRGFEKVERVRYPDLHAAGLPRWARLMRQLGGSESSELNLLASMQTAS